MKPVFYKYSFINTLLSRQIYNYKLHYFLLFMLMSFINNDDINVMYKDNYD